MSLASLTMASLFWTPSDSAPFPVTVEFGEEANLWLSPVLGSVRPSLKWHPTKHPLQVSWQCFKLESFISCCSIYTAAFLLEASGVTHPCCVCRFELPFSSYEPGTGRESPLLTPFSGLRFVSLLSLWL